MAFNLLLLYPDPHRTTVTEPSTAHVIAIVIVIAVATATERMASSATPLLPLHGASAVAATPAPAGTRSRSGLFAALALAALALALVALASSSSSPSSSPPSPLASPVDPATTATTASCASLGQDACGKTPGCTWCTSYAIPSRCYTTAEAQQLPSGVFVCKAPSLVAAGAAALVDGAEPLLDANANAKQQQVQEDEAFPRIELTHQTEPNAPSLCDPNVKQLSGYFRISATKKLFFWFFESRRAPATDPVVMWLSGGPGCSSSIALFGENGPCTVEFTDAQKTTTQTKLNPFSWNSRANTLFLDQPAGTGFSVGRENDHNEDMVARDIYAFLVAFFSSPKGKAFQPNKFFLFGESYAGHYVPHAAATIHRNNKRFASLLGLPVINLAGASVGNGLMDPEVQYAKFPAMAKPLIPAKVYDAMVASVAPCVRQIRACQALTKWWSIPVATSAVCEAAVDFCNSNLIAPVQLAGYNWYDVREQCKVRPLCYDFSAIDAYLNRVDVRKALGVPGGVKPWEECSSSVHRRMTPDWMLNYLTDFPELLADKIPVLIYAGDTDYICNWIGGKAAALAMEWPGKGAFNEALDADWLAGSGRVRSFGGFTFLQVFQAGHMVPRDQPEVALKMLDQFVAGKFSTFGGAGVDAAQ